MYRFYVVASNSCGRSGNSPILSTIAAVLPGMDSSSALIYNTEPYQPRIIDVQETSIKVEWFHPEPRHIGGSAITGFKLYMYEGVARNTKTTPEPVKQEIQRIEIFGSGPKIGTFTISFDGNETDDIDINASSLELKHDLENIPSINIVVVDPIPHGWQITFISEAGNLPLLEVSTGRLMNPPDLKVTVNAAPCRC